jgi:hypothetical protein
MRIEKVCLVISVMFTGRLVRSRNQKTDTQDQHMGLYHVVLPLAAWTKSQNECGDQPMNIE